MGQQASPEGMQAGKQKDDNGFNSLCFVALNSYM